LNFYLILKKLKILKHKRKQNKKKLIEFVDSKNKFGNISYQYQFIKHEWIKINKK